MVETRWLHKRITRLGLRFLDPLRILVLGVSDSTIIWLYYNYPTNLGSDQTAFTSVTAC